VVLIEGKMPVRRVVQQREVLMKMLGLDIQIQKRQFQWVLFQEQEQQAQFAFCV